MSITSRLNAADAGFPWPRPLVGATGDTFRCVDTSETPVTPRLNAANAGFPWLPSTT